jgi:hypothetical protein
MLLRSASENAFASIHSTAIDECDDYIFTRARSKTCQKGENEPERVQSCSRLALPRILIQ